jgi:hypothetical protein
VLLLSGRRLRRTGSARAGAASARRGGVSVQPVLYNNRRLLLQYHVSAGGRGMQPQSPLNAQIRPLSQTGAFGTAAGVPDAISFGAH